ncbi:MAG: carotenoid oxygenase family protein [Cyanobacteria bacterium]|nr:carotenoid oxygenase family protein [Cyanobacteriota bacterium]
MPQPDPPGASRPWATFPASMMRASAAEVSDLDLQVVTGTLPPDLAGHLFMVAPVGSVTSNGLPNPSGAHVWNGNGLVFRFDFDQPGRVRLTTRLAKTPCFYADTATVPGSPHEKLRFHDFGMARFSLSLGMRNLANTALIPMPVDRQATPRLLITFDGGRPFELDPHTLKLITPVGRNREWRPGIELNMPFEAVLSTAHPVFDPVERTLYTVNYGRSMVNFLTTIPCLYNLSEIPAEIERALEVIASWFSRPGPAPGPWAPIARLLGALLKPVQGLLSRLTGVADFVHLIRWDGEGAFERWALVDQQGQPVRIEQTMHQVGASRHHVVLMDTSLKFGLEQILGFPVPGSPSISRILRLLLTRPQSAFTTLYFVAKKDLVPSIGDDIPNVTVRQLTIPLETGHFLVDQAEAGDDITLYLAHECASDVSEWIRSYDQTVKNHQPMNTSLEGMIAVGAMDVGRLGRYVVDASTGQLRHGQVLEDRRRTWGLGLYSCPALEQNSGQTRSIGSIYFLSLGFWRDLLPEFIYRLYEEYPHRSVPLDDILSPPEASQERPSSLMRWDTRTMTIADAYDFPLGDSASARSDTLVANSPQFIPREDKADLDPDLNGYLVCTVIGEHRKELWIFDAADLAAGPLCRLAHPSFQPGYTVHTCWMAQVNPRQSTYRIPIRDDYQDLVAKAGAEVQALFEEQVYPAWDKAQAEANI